MTSSHIGDVTANITAFKTAAPGRFYGKVVGVLLAGTGVLLLHAEAVQWLPKDLPDWFDKASIGLIVLGVLTATLDVVRIPIDYAVAVVKTLLQLKNGTGTPG